MIAARPGATLSGLAERPGQKDLIARAIGYAALGDEESALDWLERAYESRADWFPRIAARVPAGDSGASRAALLELRRFRTLVSHPELPETDSSRVRRARGRSEVTNVAPGTAGMEAATRDARG